MNWQLSGLFREAWSNVYANAPRSLALVAVFAAAIGSVAFLELQQTNGARSFELQYRAAGGYVAIVSGQGPIISMATCAALNGRAGVVAAGGIRVTGTKASATSPGTLFQSASVTSATLRVWDPGVSVDIVGSANSFVAGVGLAKELGLRRGGYLAPAGEPPAVVAAIVELSARNGTAQRWLFSVAPPVGKADECWIEFTKDSFEPGLASVAAAFADGSQDPIARPYLRRDQFTRNPKTEFAERPQRFGWLAVGCIALAIGALVAWFRKAEIALYLAVGTSRVELAMLFYLEAMLTMAAAWLVGMLWTFALERVFHHPLPRDGVLLALRSASSGTLLAILAAPLASYLLARSNVAAMLKDR
ncbi:MAG: hypothetical protein HYX53_10705 [Chloroflexi bacterium]|nr:hypothetical protein [Chloroflexota bacterium]